MQRGRLFGGRAAVAGADDGYVDAAAGTSSDEHEADLILRDAAAAAPSGAKPSMAAEDPQPAAAARPVADAPTPGPPASLAGPALKRVQKDRTGTRALEQWLSREEDARRQLVQELHRMRTFVWRWTALCATLAGSGALLASVAWLAATVAHLNAQVQALQAELQSVRTAQAQTTAQLASTSQQLMTYQYEEFDRRGARHHDGCIIC
ncbi:hypothetical protein HXX76_007153 [Chlamydomonas incerta]|uniref:Uncharacterized protein n=1 Tax=Chlamydomonas incerta TaxID=51695 RepID=A0A835W3Q0_CHLIN|nr:hypothetical protein HXX76_007153 [Chlamydomonas incerta]|eukprot:KAG2435959.1 hypothetical protein HXX76_007153 [Chlamydomonas incerta]